jgi:uncharacterized protein
MLRLLSCLVLLFGLGIDLNGARAAPADDAAAATRIARAQAGQLTVIAGGIGGTDARIAADLANVLDDNDRLRIMPVLGRGSLQDIADLLFARGIDAAIVQSDVLGVVRQGGLMPNASSLQYITKLYEEEVHILARRDIEAVQDLVGKPVNIDRRGSGTAITAALVLERLGVAPVYEYNDQMAALEKLKKGELAAVVYVVAKPAPLFIGLDFTSGLHFLPIPLTAALIESYLPSRLEQLQYPNLVLASAPVDTIAVSAVMMTVGSGAGNERYRRLARFVDALFTHIDELRGPGRHPKWQEVNLAAQMPGWTRFPEAQTQLNKQIANAETSLRAAFNVFLSQQGRVAADLDSSTKDALFKEFIEWQPRRP